MIIFNQQHSRLNQKNKTENSVDSFSFSIFIQNYRIQFQMRRNIYTNVLSFCVIKLFNSLLLLQQFQYWNNFIIKNKKKREATATRTKYKHLYEHIYLCSYPAQISMNEEEEAEKSKSYKNRNKVFECKIIEVVFEMEKH